MSFSIDQSLSLMIPRVFPQWIDEQTIIDIFHQQHLGRVYKVSIIRVPDSKKRSFPIYKAIIYFSAWYDNTIAYNFQQRIFSAKKQARVVYDDPWYWVVFENKTRRLSNNDKRLMRLGYQAYLHEQVIAEQDKRIQDLEEFLKQFPAVPARSEGSCPRSEGSVPSTGEPHLVWNNLTDAFAMDTLGAELKLTETAINVAEAALYEEEVSPMDISFNSISAEWTESGNGSSWLSHQETQLNAAVTDILGAELALTETAMNVAESVLMETDEEAETELNLTETAIRVAEAALDDEQYRDDYYSSQEEFDRAYYQEQDYDY
jgi:hypothetical protein